MASDPEPHDAAAVSHYTKCPIVKTDSDRVNLVLSLEFLEMQTGMGWIFPKQTVCTLSSGLGLRG